MSTPPAGPPAPSWPYCAHGADPSTDPVGCRGIHVSGHTACLAHLTDTDRDTYLASLTPGADIDHRGTPFTQDLLWQLRAALYDTTARSSVFGMARFDEAQFAGHAEFFNVKFENSASFMGAQFAGDASFALVAFVMPAWFRGARFKGETSFDATFLEQVSFDDVWFRRDVSFEHSKFRNLVYFQGVQFFGFAYFSGVQFGDSKKKPETSFMGTQFAADVSFEEAQFAGEVYFEEAQFAGDASFERVRFHGDAFFSRALFAGDARFAEAHAESNADFNGTRFPQTLRWGPVTCAGVLELSGVVFGAPVTLEVAAAEVRCVRTRWESIATIRLRYASVNFGHAVLSAPVAVTAHPTPFTSAIGGLVDESLLTGPPGVRVLSVQGVDAALLVLTDTDVSDCLFSGAFHLDQLRLEGRTVFAPPPSGWHRHGLWPARWTRRRVLAEEHHWRAQVANQPAPSAGATPPADQWRPGSHHPDPDLTPDPDDIAPLYRQLRKAFEDGKNEPGAADFYYGECEMRRHDHTGTPRVERGLLWGYWLLSGYGLRASRALGWLAVFMLATIVLLMGLGLPASSPKQEATGTVPPGGGEVTFTIDKQPPQNPTGDRISSDRFEKALSITLNSVVFRSSGQDLTTTGTYIEMTSRLLEPTLLALAVLALRGRIKR